MTLSRWSSVLDQLLEVLDRKSSFVLQMFRLPSSSSKSIARSCPWKTMLRWEDWCTSSRDVECGSARISRHFHRFHFRWRFHFSVLNIKWYHDSASCPNRQIRSCPTLPSSFRQVSDLNGFTPPARQHYYPFPPTLQPLSSVSRPLPTPIITPAHLYCCPIIHIKTPVHHITVPAHPQLT